MQLDLQAIPSCLDEETSALVRDTAELLAQRQLDVLAIILYGSVARHEERPLDCSDTSDVDLLVVLNGNHDAVRSQMLALVHTAGLAEDRHLGARVKSLCCSPTGRCTPETPCSLRIWLATGYSSLRVDPYPFHSLHNRLFKRIVRH